MKQIYFILFSSFSLITLSCSKEDIDTNSTVTQEINSAKTFYANNGGTFKFRLYMLPTKGDKNNIKYDTAEIYKIIEDNGILSTIAKVSTSDYREPSNSAFLNCQGDYYSIASSNSVGIVGAFGDDYEIDKNHTRVIVYHSTSGAHGSYGFVGTRIWFFNPAISWGAEWYGSPGYLIILNDTTFMFSMGYNSNSTRPMLYRRTETSWLKNVVTQIDYVPGSNTNIPMTNDASKVGNTDKVYWTWLSYTSNLSNGKINIISYNGSTFSDVYSLAGIGSIGSGFTSVNTVTLHKNPNNLNNPYIVVRHDNSDTLDIYKFNGTAIEVVKTGVNLPSTITLLPGDTYRVIKDIAFSGDNIYLISGKDKNLYKLSGSSFVIEKPNLTLTDDRISALESTANGILISIIKTIPTTPFTKVVSDVVLIPN